MTPADDTTARIRRLFSEYWEFRLREDPLAASIFAGDHRYDDRLPGANEADFARRRAALEAFQAQLRACNLSDLSAEDQANFEIFARLLANQIDEIRFRGYLMPLNKTRTVFDFFAELPALLSFETTRDYEAYVARLRAFPAYVESHIGLMRTGMREGFVSPRATLEGVAEAIAPHVVDDPTESRLWQPFTRLPAAIDAAERARLSEAGRAAVMEAVVPAYRALLTFVQDEYVPAARDEIAATSLPEGAAYYQFCIRYHTTLDLTPRQIHELGLAEVQRIEAEMHEVIRHLGFAGTRAEFIAFLRSDPRFYVEQPEALLKEVAFVLKRMDGELPRLFRTLPRTPYGIRPVPEDTAPTTTTAYYQPSAADGSRAGFYYVNTYDLRSRPLYEVEALSLHEAVPGHHLQLALQQEMKDVPAFRRFEFFTAYIEGWGLYAERLGLEVGFYQDPYSNFGRLIYEMWRACRLVVDTGMHALGWTRQQAIDFMAEKSALTPLNIANEVDRYIAWPGQALAYKLGELKIRELRARAERAHGDRFDLRAFHDVVLLGGALPLDLLEANVDRWIATHL